MWPDDDRLHLVTGGRDFAQWKSIAVRRSMTHCAGDFALSVAWGRGDQDAMRRIEAGESCEVLLGEQRVMSGYVDLVEAAIDERTHDISVSGRDRTADLVDCSAIGKSGQWTGQKVEQIAAALAEPFKVQVRAEVDTGPALPSFALQEGETVFEAIVVGPFLTNGGIKTVAVSYEYNRSYYADTGTGSITGSGGATVLIEKSLDGVSWTTIGTLTGTEAFRSVVINGEPGIPDFVSYGLGGSVSLSDSQGAHAAMRLRARLTARSTPSLGGTGIFGLIDTQTISLVCTE